MMIMVTVAYDCDNLPRSISKCADDVSAILATFPEYLCPYQGMLLIQACHLVCGVICRCSHLLAQLLLQLLLPSDGCLGLAHLRMHQTQ